MEQGLFRAPPAAGMQHEGLVFSHPYLASCREEGGGREPTADNEEEREAFSTKGVDLSRWRGKVVQEPWPVWYMRPHQPPVGLACSICDPYVRYSV